MADPVTPHAATMFGINNAAMLVFLMQAGFTMLEAGSVRERNVSLLAPLRLKSLRKRSSDPTATRRPSSCVRHRLIAFLLGPFHHF
jgi:hypothetical protein